jgi:hypothetical protein
MIAPYYPRYCQLKKILVMSMPMGHIPLNKDLMPSLNVVAGHHRRSLVETHMFRLKTILGGRLRARKFTNQQTEAKIMANILNTMAHLGMSKSEKVCLDQ